MAYYVSLSVGSEHFVAVDAIGGSIDSNIRYRVDAGQQLSKEDIASFPNAGQAVETEEMHGEAIAKAVRCLIAKTLLESGAESHFC